MPPPRLEWLALEFLRILLLVLFVVFLVVFGAVQADDLELQAEQRADRRLDCAYLGRTQQYEHQHVDKLKLHVAWRLWIDQHVDVRRPFEQLSAAVMLNAGLARRSDFGRSS